MIACDDFSSALKSATPVAFSTRHNAKGGRRSPKSVTLQPSKRFIKKRIVALKFILPLILFTSLVCFAASPSADVASSFDSANKLYAQGKYADAASMYEKLIETAGVTPALYYNLGNALFKAGQIGRAIAVYRQAEQLTPHDPDLRANLEFARNQVQGPTFQASRWERWLGKLTLNEWTWVSLVVVWTTFCLLAAMQIWPRTKRSFRNWTIFSGTLAVALCGCLGCALAHRNAVHIGVVTANETEVRTGPFDESPGVFTAHDGAELRVLDHKDDWLQVTDGNRRIGWLRSSDIEMVKRT